MSEIRIVSGRYRGRKVASPKGGEVTRPLLSRLRKSLADVLRPSLDGARVLDMFGGTGAIALELLSNGAQSAVIVELNGDTAAVARENVETFEAAAEVIRGDCLDVVANLAARGELFDLIMVAPPYDLGLQEKAMETLLANPVMVEDATVVVQRDQGEPFWEPRGKFHLERTREYGRTVFDYYYWSDEA